MLKLSLTLVVSFLVFSSSFACNKQQKAIIKNVVKIVVSADHLNMLPEPPVNCENFRGEYEIVILDSLKINEIVNILNDSKEYNKEFNWLPRAKLIIYYDNGKHDVVCIAGMVTHDICVNGENRIINKNMDLFYIISSLVGKERHRLGMDKLY